MRHADAGYEAAIDCARVAVSICRWVKGVSATAICIDPGRRSSPTFAVSGTRGFDDTNARHAPDRAGSGRGAHFARSNAAYGINTASASSPRRGLPTTSCSNCSAT